MPNALVKLAPPMTVTGGRVPPRGPMVPRPDAYLMQVLSQCQVHYWTAAGRRQAKLVKFERLHNGEIGAVFELSYWNPVAMKMDVGQYLWCVGNRDGQPRELKKLWQQ